MTDPLQLPLRDIHLPEHLGWWPPAPGWWLLLGMLVLGLVLAYRWYVRRLRRQRSAVQMAKQALLTLQDEYQRHGDRRRLLADLSVLLRRLSISAFPRAEVASLTGEDWLKFLDAQMPQAAFCEGPGRMLIDAPYRAEVKEAELQPLIALCEQWVNLLDTKKAGQAK